MKRRRARGFTLIELMITLGILGILLSIAMPKYAEFMLKSQEGQTKGNLGSIRSALNLYYSDNAGIYPSCFSQAADSGALDPLVPKYIPAIPKANNGLHPPNAGVYCDNDVNMAAGNTHDGQDGWYFDGYVDPATGIDALNGTVWVACGHDDTVNKAWTSY